jgi:arsenate reductase
MEEAMDKKPKILFFSTGNATRSRMAAAILPRLSEGRLSASSTAVKSVEASPVAAEVMGEVGIDIAKQDTKPVEQSLKEHFSVVVTLSDDSKERSPVWPFTPNIVHWNMPDPVASDAPVEQQRERLRGVRDELWIRVDEFAKQVAPELVAKAG